MKAGVVLILLYSPVSPYFAGTVVELREDMASCQVEAGERIGRYLETKTRWETQVMGAVPKVIAAYCAPGAVKE